MLFELMVFCAVAAIFLIGLSVFSELRDLWSHPEHREVGGGSHLPKPR